MTTRSAPEVIAHPGSGHVPRIQRARLRMVFDSRGNPTVEAELEVLEHVVGRAASPSGASTGVHEVRAFPEGGVPVALERFNARLAPKLVNLPVDDQAGFDALLREVDGTPDLSHLGGNTTTALSMALADARARVLGVPLWRAIPGAPSEPKFPALVGNVINGGVHAIGGPEFQEYIAFVEARHPASAIQAAVAVHRAVGQALRQRFPKAALGRGDEGGWVAPLSSVEALELLSEKCKEVQDTRKAEGVSVRPGLDLAASEFYHKGRYVYRDQTLDPDGQVGFIARLVERYDLAYLEDPLEQEDFPGFARLTARVGRSGRTLVVGDDLFTTHAALVERGVKDAAANAALLKVNQVGTLSDTLRAVSVAKAAGWATIASHRSGEVTDAWLAHLALGFGSRGIKCGVLGGERMAKLNELVRLAPHP